MRRGTFSVASQISHCGRFFAGTDVGYYEGSCLQFNLSPGYHCFMDEKRLFVQVLVSFSWILRWSVMAIKDNGITIVVNVILQRAANIAFLSYIFL